MRNLVTPTLNVNPKDSPPIHSDQVHENSNVSLSYDPFAVKLSPRGWLLYAFEAYWSNAVFDDDTQWSYQEALTRLRVSESTIQRGKIETRKKQCIPVMEIDRSNPLGPEDLARLYPQHKISIPIFFAVNRINVIGKCDVSRKELARLVGCSERSVSRAIGALDLRAFIHRRHRYRSSDGRQISDLLRANNMGKSERKTSVRRQNGDPALKGSKQSVVSRRSGQTGPVSSQLRQGLSTSTVYKRVQSKGNVSDDTGSSTPYDSSFLSDVKPTHEELIESSDLLDRINVLSPGSKRLDDLRRPKDAFLFVRIYEHKFLNRLLDDYDYAERYRRKFWQGIFRNDPKSSMKMYRVGPVIGEVKDTSTGDMIQVTEELEKFAQKLFTTYRQFVKSRYSMYVRMTSKLKRGTVRYQHFIRFAHVIVENRAVRYYRLWLIAQFEQFEELRDAGIMKKRSYPQPNFLYSENAELRFFGYMQTRIDDVENRVCIDEGMGGKLRRFAAIQRRVASDGEIPPTAEEYLLSEDAEMMFMGRELLIRFFGFQVPGA